MKTKLSKSQIQKQIEEFFSDVKNKTPREVKQTKRLAMSKNIPLKEKRKLFCKKCLMPYKNPKISIKKNRKIIECENCSYIARWKLK